MTPQTPVAAPKLTAKQRKEAEAAKLAQDAETVKLALNLPPDATDEQRYGATLLRRAQDLRHQNDEIVKQRGANRDMLRGMGTAGHLTDQQKLAVEVFYPLPKPRGGDDTPTPPPVVETPKPPAQGAPKDDGKS